MTISPAHHSTFNDLATLDQLFAWRVHQSPQSEAYRQFDVASGNWISYTWSQIATRVAQWGQAIDSLHLAHGDRIAVLLPNSVNAVCVDQAALSRALVPVPMHALDNPVSIGYIINDSLASIVVLTTYQQWLSLVSNCDEMQHLKLVILAEDPDFHADATPDASGPRVLTMQQWLAETASDAAIAAAATTGFTPATEDDLAAIVYTSGTTGKPKGVMLTHRNIMSNIKAVLKRVDAGSSDVFLSFLPLSHTFERTIGYYLPIAAGSCVAYTRSVALLAEDLKIVRPTVLVSVPRIYERFYTKLQEKLASSGQFTQKLFALAQDVGWRRFCRAQKLPEASQAHAFTDALLWPILDRLVARNVLAQLGGRLRTAVTGGAPMSQSVSRCFLGLGLPLIQGYGMTESSPVVAANILDDNWPATVGRALDGVEVRIGDNSELQVRAASVMKGYWNRPDDTRNAMTADGWLRTGDQAVMEQGHIRISGRIKEIMVTSTGEKIAPADLELAIMADALFDQAMVVGENRPFISAYLVLNHKLWLELATQMQVNASDPHTLNSETVRKQVLKRVQEATKSFPHYAVPRAVWLTLDPWTVENSLITPTLKLKRTALHARLSAQIDAIYQR
ncbi:MAG: long-chain fatty acid--CoA ligase [Burkholderiales bacterium]|nr:long-chain fatty acid--CoA ligase [Burkholderiales bacterium]